MSRFRPIAAIGAALILQSGAVLAAARMADRHVPRDTVPPRAFTFACAANGPCRNRDETRQAGPGPADRAVHPFEGSLGRPCAYRTRFTPQGNRKVRVCY